MATTYGSFPGVQVTVAGGGITSVAIGDEENLVLFGAGSYQDDGTFGSDGDTDSLESDLDGSTNDPTTINARRQADTNFGDGSELANGMREALANGANIDFLYGVAPDRVQAVDEVQASQSGTLDNFPIYEDNVNVESDVENIEVVDADAPETPLDVVYWYDGSPSSPTAGDTVAINPLTGDYAADAAADGAEYQFSYKYLDWNSAFTASEVEDIVEEDETGIFCALTDADSVSTDLQTEVSDLRDVYKMVNALSGAEPNDNEVVTSDGESLETDHSNYTRRDARYDTVNYDSANQSVDQDYYFKFAPVRLEDEKVTGLGGIGGLFAGNPIDDPIYNDQLDYDALEQTFSKSDADNMRDENVIPIRQAGSVRVKDNLSTSTETDWERDFWRRRIADQVILIGKVIGDSIIGKINDPETRSSAQRMIQREMRALVEDRLLQPNTEAEENWYVEVYEDDANTNEVNIDIGFTPYGIVKRVDETITINT